MFLSKQKSTKALQPHGMCSGEGITCEKWSSKHEIPPPVSWNECDCRVLHQSLNQLHCQEGIFTPDTFAGQGNVSVLNNRKELSHTSTLQISDWGRTPKVKCGVREEIIWGDLNQILLLKLIALLSTASQHSNSRLENSRLENSRFFFPIFFPVGNFSPAPVPRANGLFCFGETENEAKSSLHLTINRLKWNFTLHELQVYGSRMENIWESFLLFHNFYQNFPWGWHGWRFQQEHFLAASTEL